MQKAKDKIERRTDDLRHGRAKGEPKKYNTHGNVTHLWTEWALETYGPEWDRNR